MGKKKSKLKACSCCGNSVRIWKRVQADGTKLHANVPAYAVMCGECLISTDDYKTRQEAIAAWNRRITEGK